MKIAYPLEYAGTKALCQSFVGFLNLAEVEKFRKARYF